MGASRWEKYDQFQVVIDQTDKLRRLAQGFHRRPADRLHRFRGQLDTGAKTLKRRELLALKAPLFVDALPLRGSTRSRGFRRSSISVGFACLRALMNPLFSSATLSRRKWRKWLSGARGETRSTRASFLQAPSCQHAASEDSSISARPTFTRDVSNTLLVRSKSTVRWPMMMACKRHEAALIAPAVAGCTAPGPRGARPSGRATR